MKTLMLMRHGNYVIEHLSPMGEKEVDATATKLAEEGLVPDVIVHSPVTRAVETAERVRNIFNTVAKKDVPMVVNHALEVGTTKKDDLMASVTDDQSLVLVVTHQPNVESISWQFGREVSPDTAEVNIFQDAAADTWKKVSKPRLVKRMR